MPGGHVRTPELTGDFRRPLSFFPDAFMLTAQKPITVSSAAARAATHPGSPGRDIQIFPAADVLHLEPELLSCYESHYASLQRLHLCGELSPEVMVYVSREAQSGHVNAALMFRRDARGVQVLNEVAHVPGAVMQEFAEHIFARWPSVGVIRFKAIRTDVTRLSRPFQRLNHLEDFVISLPATATDYCEQLGPSLRKTLRSYGARLRKRYPDFVHQVMERDQIRSEDVRAILEFSRARITAKGKKWGFDEEECGHIERLARATGLVSVIRIGGKVAGGAISFRAGRNLFMRVCSHDPHYNDLRLGTITRFHALEAAIERGARECHLLWGRQRYKYEFLARPTSLDNVTIYRSWGALLANRHIALNNLRQGALRQLKLVVWRFRDAPG